MPVQSPTSGGPESDVPHQKPRVQMAGEQLRFEVLMAEVVFYLLFINLFYIIFLIFKCILFILIVKFFYFLYLGWR